MSSVQKQPLRWFYIFSVVGRGGWMVWIFDTLSGCIGGGLLTCNNISGGLRRCKLLATLGLKFFSIFRVCTMQCFAPYVIFLYHKINNGNWTEWSAIWSEIIRMISKSNEHAARVRFEITSMILDQNCTTRSSIATLLDPFWNRTI